VAEGRAAALAAAPQLIVALECDRPLAPSSRHALAGIHEVHLRRGDRGVRRNEERGVRVLRLSVPDRAMSSEHARLVNARGRWIVEDVGSKNGVIVNGALVKRAVLIDGDLMELGRTLFLYRDSLALATAEQPDLDGRDLLANEPGLATFLAPLAEAFDAVLRVAPSSVPVTIFGETGTGKELVARAVHALSGRSGAFVPVNCGALPPNLVEATLFGHRRGAFSGALDDRPGLVRSADRGTLFLDEVGDLPISAQAAFLRVLQEQEVMAVGDTRPVRVDFRMVAATHRPLARLVEEGRFREDLFARLTGLSVKLLPLRERREDLGLLVGSLLAQLGNGQAPPLHVDAARALWRYSWPLNVRELEKCLSTAVALATGGAIRLEHLPEAVRGWVTEDTPPISEEERLRAELVALLEQHRGNVAEVARTMAKGRMQIHRWLKRFGLELDTFRK
jgi:DNA-binding NtrC family response regulator